MFQFLTNSRQNKIDKVSLETNLFLIVNSIIFLLLVFLPDYATNWKVILFIADLIYSVNRIRSKGSLNLGKILWLLLVIIVLLGVIRATNFSSSLAFVLSLSLYAYNAFLLEISDNWENNYIRALIIVVSFFVFGSVLQLFAPNLIIQFQSLFRKGVELGTATNFVRAGAIVGFTNQTGVNGFILTIGAGLTFVQIFKTTASKKKYTMFLIYLLLIYLIFLTGKRGFLVSNIITGVCLFYRLSNKKINSFFPIVALMSIFSYILIGTDIGEDILVKTINVDDPSNGRFNLISDMWRDFLKHPLLGNGTFTTADNIPFNHGHNIYMEVLRDNGIFAFIILCTFLIWNFIQSDYLLKRKKLSTNIRSLITISLYVQSTFIIWGITGNPLYDNFPLYLYLVSIAMVSSIKKKISKENV